ncbi:MAG TPA: hypothetical protein PKE45_15965, partial [Caldilineaceae bacterium]|nr:hypothetical protein [Caldilineaceae bacterium]
TAILWGSFFLVREPTEQPEQQGATASSQLPPSRGEVLQYGWFAFNSAILTLLALLFLFWPRAALDTSLPALSSLLNTYEGELSSLIASNLGVGSHLLALATASWIATAYCRSNPTLRQAVTVASTLNAGLMCLLPLRQMGLEFGLSSVLSSILILFVPLLAGWVLYLAFSHRVELETPQEACI